jgi:hypothetical protein
MPVSSCETSLVVWTAVSWYSAGPIVTLHGRSTASDYVDTLGNQLHPTIWMLPNNYAVFQDGSSPRQTAKSVQSWCEQHEDALQHLPWPAQLPELNVIKQLWSIL